MQSQTDITLKISRYTFVVTTILVTYTDANLRIAGLVLKWKYKRGF
jgi:hypothetical protein